MKTRFVITKVDRDGLRVLLFANQGRNHFDTRKAAQGYLDTTLQSLKKLPIKTHKDIYGDTTKLKVLEAECYDHGDCTRTVFGWDDAPLNLDKHAGYKEGAE